MKPYPLSFATCDPHQRSCVRACPWLTTLGRFFSLLLLASLPAFGQVNQAATIQHIIILVKENRSFDHYFGQFPGSTAVCVGGSNPGAACTTPNGPECTGGTCPYITTGNCKKKSNGGLESCISGSIPLAIGNPTIPDCGGALGANAQSGGGDCPHSLAATLAAEDMPPSQPPQLPQMDGFGGFCYQNHYQQCWPSQPGQPLPCTGTGNYCVLGSATIGTTQVSGGYEQYNVNSSTCSTANFSSCSTPFYWQMASTYGLGDHFFSYPNGPSYPNHLNMIAAQANEAVDNPTTPFPLRTASNGWTCDETTPSGVAPTPTCGGTCRVGSEPCGVGNLCTNGSQCINVTCTGQNIYEGQVLSQSPAQDSILGTPVQANDYYVGGVCQDGTNAACVCAGNTLPSYPLPSCSPTGSWHGGDSCNKPNGGTCSTTNSTGTPNSVSNTRGGICPEVTTITDRLDAAGITWGYYAPYYTTANGYEWTAPAYVQHIRFGPDWSTNVHPLSAVYGQPDNPPDTFDNAVSATTPQNNTNNPPLPNVVWVSAGMLKSEHPYYDDGPPATYSTVSAGEAWTSYRLQAIFNNPTVYNSSIIFVVWDDFGGFYDHLQPPNGLGIRVPILCIGPFCKNAVIHTQLEFGSILHCIENPPAGPNAQVPWTLNNLGGRDILAANDACAAMVNLHQTPIPAPTALARSVPVERPMQKGRGDVSDPDLVTLAKITYRWFHPVKLSKLEADASVHPTLGKQRPCFDGTKPHRAYYVTKAGRFLVDVCGSDDGKLILWPGESHQDADEPDQRKAGGK